MIWHQNLTVQNDTPHFMFRSCANVNNIFLFTFPWVHVSSKLAAWI